MIELRTQVSCVSAAGAATALWLSRPRARNPVVDRVQNCIFVLEIVKETFVGVS